MPLEYLNLGHLPVSDLSPLENMTTLRNLVLDETRVTDLAALKGLRLRSLRMYGIRVSDLSPLQGMPLEKLCLDFRPERHRGAPFPHGPGADQRGAGRGVLESAEEVERALLSPVCPPLRRCGTSPMRPAFWRPHSPAPKRLVPLPEKAEHVVA
jgi:Leucine-rich repeat (LRR) protein